MTFITRAFELEFIKVCVGYTLDNKDYDYLPFNELEQSSVKPIYKTVPGWKESTFGINIWENLPIRAQEYILFLEALMNTKISIVSTGPERSQTIDRNNLLISI